MMCFQDGSREGKCTCRVSRHSSRHGFPFFLVLSAMGSKGSTS